MPSCLCRYLKHEWGKRRGDERDVEELRWWVAWLGMHTSKRLVRLGTATAGLGSDGGKRVCE